MTFESATHRAAVLVKSLDQDQAKRLLMRLDAEDLQAVFQRIRAIGEITGEQKRTAISSFVNALRQHSSKTLATRPTSQTRPFGFLAGASSSVVYALVKNEHPAEIALIMTFLPAQLAADSLSHFEGADRVLILRRLCRMNTIDNSLVDQVSQRIELRLSNTLHSDSNPEVGKNTVTKLLSCTDPFTRNKILDELDHQDSQLCEEIQQQVFSFYDLISWNDTAIKQVLPWVDTSLWAPALKNATPALQRKVLNAFAEKPRVLLQREMGMTDAVDSLLAERARGQIVRTIISLVEDKKIQLPKTSNRKAA